MAMAEPLILVANPGSASRKYALFSGAHELASLHFEYFEGRVICTLHYGDQAEQPHVDIPSVSQAPSQITHILRSQDILQDGQSVSRIGLRVVAPGSFFLHDRIITDEVVNHLRHLASQAPIHIGATIDELDQLQLEFPDTPVVGVSDSAFHITKPDYAWNYGLPLEDADRLDIKRFGYHGISAGAIIDSLKSVGKHNARVVIAHLGSGSSITAVDGGRSIDTTMGYSPLEGLIMSTRSGSLDLTAAQAIKQAFDYDDAKLEYYLNHHSGLLGLGGNSDIRELLRRESNGDHRAELALGTYVHVIQKSIGQMTAVLGGLDVLVFTGTVGERSDIIRTRILERFGFLNLELDADLNSQVTNPEIPTLISQTKSIPIYAIPARENALIAERTMIS